MARLFVPENPEGPPGAAHSEAVQQWLARRRKRDTANSFLGAAVIVVGVMIILGMIALVPWSTTSPTIVTYRGEPPEEEPPERPEMTKQSRPRPAGATSSRAKVIASSQPAPVSVPVPDNPVPEGPFGMSEENGEGFGSSEGDGDGGGGASFFGNYRRGKRVVFIVDFSGSMGSDVEGGGGTRLTALKKELVRSI
ncbi:MAG: hypothetical protein HKO57_11865, partial [Akkermansiaceae bacterium]|nr:hypothetical protein [Akkermansiaceae bacterium]